MISPLADKVILTPYHHDGPGSNGTITRVVIHGTVSPCVVGGAESNAHYFQTASAGGAAHYVVDPEHVVCCVDEDSKAAHAPPNAGSIGVELCDPQTGDPVRWDDTDHRKILELAGRLVADICARHNLPLEYLDTADLLAGKTGITGHVNVAQAWHQSDHTDPRDMPIDRFMSYVHPQEEHEVPQPALVEDDQHNIWRFTVGSQGDLVAKRNDDNPYSLGGKLTSGPGATKLWGDRIAVDVEGTDGGYRLIINTPKGDVSEPWRKVA